MGLSSRVVPALNHLRCRPTASAAITIDDLYSTIKRRKLSWFDAGLLVAVEDCLILKDDFTMDGWLYATNNSDTGTPDVQTLNDHW